MSEATDLEEMKRKRNEEYFSAFCAFRDILRYTPEELRVRGHKTVEGCLKSTVEYYLKRTDKLLADHIKKYPD